MTQWAARKIEQDEHGTFEQIMFARNGIQFDVKIATADETFVTVDATWPGGNTWGRRFEGWDREAVINEARGVVADVLYPQDRPRYGTTEWEMEVEGELIRAEEEAALYGR